MQVSQKPMKTGSPTFARTLSMLQTCLRSACLANLPTSWKDALCSPRSVNASYTPALHVGHHALLHQGFKNAAVAIRINRDLVLFFEQVLPAFVADWIVALREKQDILLSDTEELVLTEEVFDDLFVIAVAHYVHRNVNRFFEFPLDQVLQPSYSLDVKLED